MSAGMRSVCGRAAGVGRRHCNIRSAIEAELSIWHISWRRTLAVRALGATGPTIAAFVDATKTK